MDFIQVVSSREFQAAVLILASFTAAVVSLFKSHYFLKTLRRKLSTQDYVNAKELVKEVDNGSHPFVIEKAYQAVSGDSSLNAKEVTYLLSLPSPSQTLEKYTSSSKYLQFVPEGQEHSDRILFKDHYDKSKIKRAKFLGLLSFSSLHCLLLLCLLFVCWLSIKVSHMVCFCWLQRFFMGSCAVCLSENFAGLSKRKSWSRCSRACPAMKRRRRYHAEN